MHSSADGQTMLNPCINQGADVCSYRALKPPEYALGLPVPVPKVLSSTFTGGVAKPRTTAATCSVNELPWDISLLCTHRCEETWEAHSGKAGTTSPVWRTAWPARVTFLAWSHIWQRITEGHSLHQYWGQSPGEYSGEKAKSCEDLGQRFSETDSQETAWKLAGHTESTPEAGRATAP